MPVMKSGNDEAVVHAPLQDRFSSSHDVEVGVPSRKSPTNDATVDLRVLHCFVHLF